MPNLLQSCIIETDCWQQGSHSHEKSGKAVEIKITFSRCWKSYFSNGCRIHLVVQLRHVWMDPGSAGVSGLIIRHPHPGDPARGDQTAICVQVALYATCHSSKPKANGKPFQP